MINNFLPLLIRKPDQTKQNFRDPFFKELLKDSGGPLLHPPQWGESFTSYSKKTICRKRLGRVRTDDNSTMVVKNCKW